MTQPTQVDTPSRNTRGRAWSITINNYTTEEFNEIKESLKNDTMTQQIWGEEVGEIKHTPHLQGGIKYANARSFLSVKKTYPRAKIEPCRNWDALVNYCKKDGKYITNIKEEKSMEDIKTQYIKDTFNEVKWYNWQEEVLNIMKTKTNRRTIYWYWEPDGNVGKSFLSEYLFLHYNTLIINGKQNDIFHAIANYLETEKKYPELIIADIPRENLEYISYSTLEKLKDGVFFSGKYEGKQIWLPPLHLICLANNKPKENKISSDRWHLKQIEI